MSKVPPHLDMMEENIHIRTVYQKMVEVASSRLV